MIDQDCDGIGFSQIFLLIDIRLIYGYLIYGYLIVDGYWIFFSFLKRTNKQILGQISFGDEHTVIKIPGMSRRSD